MEEVVVKIGLCWFGGVGVGLFYFAGLWWTVKRLPGARYPGVWALGSFLIRAGLSVWLVYLMTGGRWQGILPVMAGFFLARFLAVRRWRSAPAEGAMEG